MVDFILRLSIPIQKLMQKIHKPYPLVRASFYLKAIEIIQPGDVLLSREKWHFTNLFIPGFWKHAAIVGPDPGWVIEVVGDEDRSCRRVHIAEWILTKDYVLILRSPFRFAATAAAEWCQDKVGKTLYDYLFKRGFRSLFCNEMVASAYNMRIIRRHKKNFSVPTDLALAHQFEKLLDSRDLG